MDVLSRSVVTKDIKDDCVVASVPLKVIQKQSKKGK